LTIKNLDYQDDNVNASPVNLRSVTVAVVASPFK
jgi:hypothetical protein